MLIFNPREFNPENIRKLGQASRAPCNTAGLVGAVALAAGGAVRHCRRGRNRMESYGIVHFYWFSGRKTCQKNHWILTWSFPFSIVSTCYYWFSDTEGLFSSSVRSLRMINPHDEHGPFSRSSDLNNLPAAPSQVEHTCAERRNMRATKRIFGGAFPIENQSKDGPIENSHPVL